MSARGGAYRRNKGARGEREVARLLREHGVPARRGVQFQGSPSSPDVLHALDEIAFIEVKLTNRLSIEPWYDQAVVDAGHRMPVIMHRKTRPSTRWRATLSLSHLLFLLDVPFWEEVDRGEIAEISEALSDVPELTPRLIKSNALRFDAEFRLATRDELETGGVPVLLHARREHDALWMASLYASPFIDLLTEHAENVYEWPIRYGTEGYPPEVEAEYRAFWQKHAKRVFDNMPLYVERD